VGARAGLPPVRAPSDALQAWITRSNAPKSQNLGVTLAKPALNVGKGAVSLLATLGTMRPCRKRRWHL
jgi:hypothetical protein